MARPSKLSLMSIDALLKLRDDVAKALRHKSSELKAQLAELTNDAGYKEAKRKSPAAGRTVAAQFRSKKNRKLVWSGRGVIPRWMRDEMKGTKLTKESFRIKAA